MKKRVTHEDIARKTGINRSTVSKILNRTPGYEATEATRRKVLQAAEELGFNFDKVNRTFLRRSQRILVGIHAMVSIVLYNGLIHDTGTALVANISTTGALLTELWLAKGALPLQQFTIHFFMRGHDELRGLQGRCDVVRFNTDDPEAVIEVGVSFQNMSDIDKRNLEKYINSQKEALI